MKPIESLKADHAIGFFCADDEIPLFSCKRSMLLTLCIAFTTVSVCTQKFAQRVTPFWTPLKR